MGKVVGNVVATIKTKSHQKQKLMVVQPVDEQGVPYADPIIAVDCAQSGVGDLVLIIEEGGSARDVMGDSEAAVDTIIVGVIDSFHVSE